ncbi:hypothetical protein QTL86_02920 [Cellulosilyticum sp. ST5]|uniref:Uncharacterized protein n=1 Tax=Cellulosilyticum lentocellum (strain ATCC 49066 / DSM 5427 / NCIMB 11756 / RHM5) TaxID=642492 RepID=F2JLQ2_CELLD|nr:MULTISPECIES: hypothetical protein [Cellulosilyticum]ADZ84578.1 hypothetical protein Clole_2880 [Cellulosilyticum lentocellum DSM 5427]
MDEVGRVIGYDNSLVWDLLLQGISTVILLVLVVFIIRLCLLGIKALKIYIKKNS